MLIRIFEILLVLVGKIRIATSLALPASAGTLAMPIGLFYFSFISRYIPRIFLYSFWKSFRRWV